MRRYYYFFAITIVVSLVAAVSLYLLRRGPVADQLLSDNIRTIASEIDNYYLTKNALPSALDQVSFSTAELTARAGTLEYRVVDRGETAGSNAQYELCASFQTKQMSANSTVTYGGVPDPSYHDKGRQCFTYTQLAAFKR